MDEGYASNDEYIDVVMAEEMSRVVQQNVRRVIRQQQEERARRIMQDPSLALEEAVRQRDMWRNQYQRAERELQLSRQLALARRERVRALEWENQRLQKRLNMLEGMEDNECEHR